jgi:hypothetical protein
MNEKSSNLGQSSPAGPPTDLSAFYTDYSNLIKRQYEFLDRLEKLANRWDPQPSSQQGIKEKRPDPGGAKVAMIEALDSHRNVNSLTESIVNRLEAII